MLGCWGAGVLESLGCWSRWGDVSKTAAEAVVVKSEMLRCSKESEPSFGARASVRCGGAAWNKLLSGVGNNFNVACTVLPSLLHSTCQMEVRLFGAAPCPDCRRDSALSAGPWCVR